MSLCLKREEIFRYLEGKISTKEERRIESHLYGDEIGTEFDKELEVNIILYRYNGCGYCLKTMSEINQSPEAMVSKHIT